MSNSVRRIGIVGYTGVQALDLVGPADAFAAANALAEDGATRYEILILGLQSGAFVAESGLSFLPQEQLQRCSSLDTVIVPGGAALRTEPDVRSTIAQWLQSRAKTIRRISSTCTGIYALAEAGLLNERRATTHWRFAGDVGTRWPKIRLDSDAIFIKDGKFYTSAGITAGIDLALGLIEEDLGSDVAVAVARELVVYLKRSGGQLQYSEPLRLQSRAGDKFSDIVSWMLDHLNRDLSVEVLAERAHLSTRHFNRKFKVTFGSTPADFVEGLRLDHARWLLANDVASVESLAASVGYRNDDTFRRAFQRRFGTVPSTYRGRFAARAATLTREE
ncbi:MAG TPA: helix-turn-helix domain-containing protein [Candidatus Baltobacteraceae bacterium]|jgi:transcriptional regulator GlxA family with amidase domain|nr:helix-turn-helix domain-containing protein [Candidatus Baltobacteraceae bacterium]